MKDDIGNNIFSVASDTSGAAQELTTAHEYQRRAGRRAACLMLILAVVVGVVLLAVSLHLVSRTLADMALIGIVLIPFVWIYIFMRNVIFARSLSPHSKDFPAISLTLQYCFWDGF